jgi:hypothetical protein
MIPLALLLVALQFISATTTNQGESSLVARENVAAVLSEYSPRREFTIDVACRVLDSPQSHGYELDVCVKDSVTGQSKRYLERTDIYSRTKQRTYDIVLMSNSAQDKCVRRHFKEVMKTLFGCARAARAYASRHYSPTESTDNNFPPLVSRLILTALIQLLDKVWISLLLYAFVCIVCIGFAWTILL